jgi:two-component system sensor histidine kinase KdpD
MHVAPRGKLRVYLGAAPGVGKTVALLAEGRRAVERGRDVVLAAFDAHGRPYTLQLAAPLLGTAACATNAGDEIRLELDWALARAPQLMLVDELAVENPSSSRNKSRWQDVEQLLCAGIDVVTTLNIAELESLSDVAAEITGATPAATVPDAFVRAAEQIELVDMTPEALRRRLAHGNVYPAERVDVALAHQFRVENLAGAPSAHAALAGRSRGGVPPSPSGGVSGLTGLGDEGTGDRRHHGCAGKRRDRPPGSPDRRAGAS